MTTHVDSSALVPLYVPEAFSAACTTFVSADDRQLAVAKASGLELVDIRTRLRPAR